MKILSLSFLFFFAIRLYSQTVLIDITGIYFQKNHKKSNKHKYDIIKNTTLVNLKEKDCNYYKIQDSLPILGTYGVYLDQSTYTELIIYKNKTFEYLDREMQGVSFKCTGKWKVEKHKLILFDYGDNHSKRPMPVSWEINDNQLSGEMQNTKRHLKFRKPN